MLLELKDLLAPSGPAAGDGLAAGLAVWREEMDRAWRRAGPSLTPSEREDLVRLVREVRFLLEEEIQGRERDKRALLVRLLSCLAARNALDSYRRPPARSFFNRTV
jgi:hypothetical protein